MLVLCGGALLVGTAASIAIPFAPFAMALALAAILGAVWAAFHGIGPGQIALDVLGLFVSTQVGYGLGLIGAAAAGVLFGSRRRPTPVEPVRPGLSDLHLGEKP